ncbi:MAG: glycosyltransferase family 4 protein [Halarcobacter sp.]
MKILIVHNFYQSQNIGGEDIVYKNELKSLKNHFNEENIFSYEVSNDKIDKFKLLFDIWFSWNHYKNIKKIVKEHNIDIVHVHNFYPLLTPSVFKGAKDGGAKVIHTLHNYRMWCISGIFYRDLVGICEDCINNKISFAGIRNKCFRKSFSQSFLTQMVFWFYKVIKIFDNIDYFFVLTKFQKYKIMELGIDESKILFKPNSLFINKSKSMKKENYVYVGRLEESKGIYNLLDTWLLLDNKYILNIVGGGDLENELKEKYKKNNIIFKGKLSRKETLEVISCSKYLIQSSLMYETFGLTIIEAMTLGTPVIGFNIGTRNDLIKHEENGFIVNKNELKKIVEYSFDYQNYEFLSKNAIIMSKKYENEYVTNLQLELYQKILEN